MKGSGNKAELIARLEEFGLRSVSVEAEAEAKAEVEVEVEVAAEAVVEEVGSVGSVSDEEEADRTMR